MITSEAYIKRNEHQFLASELGDEMVMMNLETGDYIGLNEVSADIWKLLEQPSKTFEIIEKLMDIYEVSRTDCEGQTIKCLNEMQDLKMIQLA